MKSLDLAKIQEAQRKIVAEREWGKFHTPKNLALSTVIESGELAELFQWLTDDESFNLKNDPAKLAAVSDEIADVFYYLVRLADVLEIDLEKAFWSKLQRSLEKYPVEKARGNAKKYNEF